MRTDPTAVDWGTNDSQPVVEAPVVAKSVPTSSSMQSTIQTYKCTALYSYTVSNIFNQEKFN